MAEPGGTAARIALEAIGLLPDTEIDPADAALQLARLDSSDADWRDAAAVLSELARDASVLGEAFRGHGGHDDATYRAGALAAILHGRHGFRGDQLRYDDLDNANLVRVIERRRGLPVALGLLWLHCIRAAGWEGWGVDFPGHFLLALTAGGAGASGSGADRAPVLVDAFNNGAVMNAEALRAARRRLGHEDAALQPGMLRPMSTRDVLLRLQRNLVQRRLAADAPADALRALDGMLLIAPDEAQNRLLAADLHARMGQVAEAIGQLEWFLRLVPEGRVAEQVRLRIDALRR
ncbi:tetratricopeptide repeat protein [Rhizosaccharibacter radicis]|uniref:Transglutaminase-like domain-containing protein n=1 Tax=Rhizosaccharibacter radicis TaxID=2782605 RepID=A0ABT1VU48_9PROT|nr:transglutaminase-like domain-containing protein [Acetobacteraceae bacterium KSS12]